MYELFCVIPSQILVRVWSYQPNLKEKLENCIKITIYILQYSIDTQHTLTCMPCFVQHGFSASLVSFPESVNNCLFLPELNFRRRELTISSSLPLDSISAAICLLFFFTNYTIELSFFYFYNLFKIELWMMMDRFLPYNKKLDKYSLRNRNCSCELKI